MGGKGLKKTNADREVIWATTTNKFYSVDFKNWTELRIVESSNTKCVYWRHYVYHRYFVDLFIIFNTYYIEWMRKENDKQRYMHHNRE